MSGDKWESREMTKGTNELDNTDRSGSPTNPKYLNFTSQRQLTFKKDPSSKGRQILEPMGFFQQPGRAGEKRFMSGKNAQ